MNDVLTFEHQPDGTSLPQCIGVQITNDNVYEAVEMFVVELQSTDVSPDPSADSAMVVILNEDSTFLPVCLIKRDLLIMHVYKQLLAGIVISLEQTMYTVLESENSRQVCAVLSMGTQIPVSITLATEDQSAISMSLYNLKYNVLPIFKLV